MSSKVFVIALAMATLCLTGTAAAATSGTAKGRIVINPSLPMDNCGSNCSGWRWKNSMNGSTQPIRHAVVEIWSGDETEKVGVGKTDKYGNFSIRWTSSRNRTHLRYRWLPKYYNRFEVKTGSGGSIYFPNGGSVRITSSTTDFGTLTWGDNPRPKVYFTASEVYHNAARLAYPASSRFTGVEIHVGAGSTDAKGKRVRMEMKFADDWVAVLHEMGHLISHMAQGHKSCAKYDRDGAGHSFRSEEHACAGFEEGLATALGMPGVFTDRATHPKLWGEDLENLPSCPSGSRRWELSVTGFVRDFYDSNQERNDDMAGPLQDVTVVLSRYGGGTGEHDKNEPWRNRFLNKVTDKDGRSGVDFQWVAINKANYNSSKVNAIYNQNCRPIGD